MKKKIIFLVTIGFLGWIGYQWGTEVIRQRVQSVLTRQLERKTYVGEVRLRLPLDLQLENIRIFEKGSSGDPSQSFLEIPELRIRPDPLAWVGGQVGVAQIHVQGARLYLVRNADGTLNCSDMISRANETPKVSLKAWPLWIQSLILREGRVILVDRALTGSEGFQTVLSDVRLSIQGVSLPIRPTTVIHFNLISTVGPGVEIEESQSRVQLKGWINWHRRDLKAQLNIEDLEVAQFRPYFQNSKFFSSLESCRINFISEAQSEENRLIARCNLYLADMMVSRGNPFEGKLFGVSSSTLWQWIQQSGNDSSLELVAKGHLVPFQIASVNFSTDVMKSFLAGNVSLRMQQVAQEGKVIVQESQERIGKTIEKTGIPTAIEKTEKVAKETKESLEELLP